ncbi:hypothetical protein V5E97_11695 [Singulisphaera sp. Ch08]|uniref:Uncharacterized protein n=1 Tax=Singulisphaera sp. Ch08 TaxID=3120278 RepID=A0AAU7CMI0_9BACT
MKESIASICIILNQSTKSSPLYRDVDGTSVIDIIGNSNYQKLYGHLKLIYLVLMSTVKDRGTAIQFEPYHGESGGKSGTFLRMFTEIDGKLWELDPPPPWPVWRSMVREFEAMTSLASFRHRLAAWIHRLASQIDGQPRPRREGRFLLRADDETIAVKLVAWPSDQGERIFLTLDPISATLSERVRLEMKRLDLLVEAETSDGRRDDTVDSA